MKNVFQRVTRRFGLALAIAMLLAPHKARAQAQDPVEELRRVLATGGGTQAPTPELLNYRRTKTQEAADSMKSIGQLVRALAIDEWKVDPDRPGNQEVRAVDTEMRRMIGQRLTKMLESAAAKGSPTTRLFVANTIAEMGPTVRALNPGDKGGYTRSLEPLVARLCEDSDLGVRQEALRALGNLNGNPKSVADIFKRVLQSDKEIGPRRLSADGLHQLIKVVTHIQKRGETARGLAATRADLIDVLQAVAPVAAVGVKDSDSEVRMLSLVAVQAAAQALAELIELPQEFVRKNLPAQGQKNLSVEERNSVIEAYRQAEENLELVKPMLDSFKKEMTTYAIGLRDPEPRVRLAATRAFENLGNARLRLVRRANNLPTLLDAAGMVERSPAELMKEADFMQPVLDRDMPQVALLLRDPDVRIRRSTAEALEVLEVKALPAMTNLILALQDPDRIVRSTAAKTLGFMPVEKAGAAVMPLATALSDPDINVRINAASSLGALAAAAKEAIPALSEAIQKGDIEARLAALYALKEMPADSLINAIPALINCLRLTDEPRAIVLACQIIENIGPPAKAALPRLRQLVGHQDAEVRRSASAAGLAVDPPSE